MKPRVSIIIVYYKGLKRLLKCLESIKKNVKGKYEIVVVDNSEERNLDKKIKRFSLVHYIKAPGNIGYGAGNNLGARYAKGKYLFILNPDTQVLPSSVKKLTRFLDEHKKCAIVAPKQVNEKGKTIHQIGNGELTPLRAIFALSFLNKVFPNNPFSRAYWRKDKINNDPVQVDTVAGSAFIIRKTVFEKVGGFDENFFLYFEEQDLCKRVKELRLNIYINPKAQVIHYWQPGKPNTTLSKKIFANSRFYYFKKHYGLFKALLVECFARFSKTSLIFLFIFCIGAFLRFL